MKNLSIVLITSMLSFVSVAEAGLGERHSNGLGKFGTVAPSLVATRAPASIATAADPKKCGYEGGLVNCAVSDQNNYSLLMPHQ